MGFYRFNQEGLYKGRFLTHEVPFNPHIHMTQNMLNLIYAAHSPKSDIPPTKRIPDDKDTRIPKYLPPKDIEQKVRKKLAAIIPLKKKNSKIILINPNASDIVPLRRWPGIRTFVFFGPKTPELFGPLGEKSHVFYKGMACSPCVSAFNQKHSPCRDNQCLKSITPEEVFEKVLPYLVQEKV